MLNKTRNAWQSLACSPPGIAVSATIVKLVTCPIPACTLNQKKKIAVDY